MTLTLRPAEQSGSEAEPAHVPGVGTIESVQAEVQDVLLDLKEMHKVEPDAALTACAAHMARLVEISVLLTRVVNANRRWKPVLNEIAFVIDALKEQASISSRLITVRGLDQQLAVRTT